MKKRFFKWFAEYVLWAQHIHLVKSKDSLTTMVRVSLFSPLRHNTDNANKMTASNIQVNPKFHLHFVLALWVFGSFSPSPAVFAHILLYKAHQVHIFPISVPGILIQIVFYHPNPLKTKDIPAKLTIFSNQLMTLKISLPIWFWPIYFPQPYILIVFFLILSQCYHCTPFNFTYVLPPGWPNLDLFPAYGIISFNAHCTRHITPIATETWAPESEESGFES